VHAVTHLLCSSQALFFLKDYWGMSTDEAAKAVSWAVTTLAESARRRGKRGSGR
jgi:hypothetical protein